MKHIPNILSFFRITLIPFYFNAILNHQMLDAGLILILSGITDFLDGLLARRFNWITKLGALLDPLADKLTQTAISLSFIFLIKEYAIYFWIILTKDAIMLLASFFALQNKLEVSSAKWFGKVATFAFYVVMILIILIPNLPNTLIHTMLTVVVGLSIFSMLMYIPIFLESLKDLN